MSVFQARNEGGSATVLGLTTPVIKSKKGCLKPLVAGCYVCRADNEISLVSLRGDCSGLIEADCSIIQYISYPPVSPVRLHH